MPVINDITVRLKQGGEGFSPHNPLPNDSFDLSLQWGQGSTQVIITRQYPSSIKLVGFTIEEVEYLTYCLLKKIQEVRDASTKHGEPIQAEGAHPELHAP